MHPKTIRWQQRFQNLLKAHDQLKKGVAITHPNDIEQQGIIQSFEFTFELAWKTLKDYLESQSIPTNFPKEVIKQAFQYQLIQDGDAWMDMLEKRNLMSHTYDKEKAELALDKIKNHYFSAVTQVITHLKQLST